MSVLSTIHRVEEIDYSVVPHLWLFARNEASRIGEHWARLIAQRPRMFDGRVLLQRHAEFSAEGGRRILRGECFETSFSSFMAWRDFGFPDLSVRNCFGMAALRADDGFLLGEMGEHTANAGRIYFPAGTPEPGDAKHGKLDLAGSVARELFEETDLTPDEVDFDKDWIVVDAGPRMACMKIGRVAGTAAGVAAEIDARIARQDDPELARMHVVRSTDDLDPQRMPPFILAFLQDMFAAP